LKGQIDPPRRCCAIFRKTELRDSREHQKREAIRRRDRDGLTSLAVTKEEKQTFESTALASQAQLQQAQANLDQARVNLERTQIRSPVNGM
jgi:multidrug resistance efflux pump